MSTRNKPKDSSKRHLNFKDRTGERFTTNEGYTGVIIEYFGAFNCTIKLSDNTILYKIKHDHTKTGSIRNPNHKSICLIGYLGQGKYSRENNYKAYDVWKGMLERCYDKKTQEKSPTYIGCFVDKRWHNFQNFAKWYDENFNPETMQGWHLDKDILIKGNKVYSSDTCCFVPSEINNMFTNRKNKRGLYPMGVSLNANRKYQVTAKINNVTKYFGSYDTPEEAFQVSKKAKENYIKQKADEWKDLIDQKVYEAMINFQINITD